MKYKVYDDRIEIDIKNEYKDIHDFLDAFYIPTKKQNHLINTKKIILDGYILTIYLEKEEIDYEASIHDVEVIYEDELLLIVHKDAGYIIHDKNDNNCLNSRVAKYYLDNNINSYIRPIHRLDKETAGLVIYSKISFFQPYFDKQIEDKKIKRFYKAIVKGNCQKNKQFVIKANIGRNRHRSGTYIVSKTGKEAITKVKCLTSKDNYSLFRCELETGRTHQIRVHLAHKNYPIINDPQYGKEDTIIPYMGLWADELIFTHPLTKKEIIVKDKHRKDFKI